MFVNRKSHPSIWFMFVNRISHPSTWFMFVNRTCFGWGCPVYKHKSCR
jgi:hypothetical protein